MDTEPLGAVEIYVEIVDHSTDLYNTDCGRVPKRDPG